MEPGVVVAAYTAETVVEGAAIGAFAVSRPTVPLHIRFYRLSPPSKLLARSSHTVNVVKGKAYIYGGDVAGEAVDDAVHAVTLPSDLALKDIDYQAIPAVAASERPLAPYSDTPAVSDPANTAVQKNAVPAPRAAHTSAAIDSTIYVLGGRPPRSSSSPSSTTPLDENGLVHAFDTVNNSWSTLRPHPTKCSSGMPCPRTHASGASTSHPEQSGDHGTIFLHGGYDVKGKLLRDVWAFDVASRIWSKWHDVPPPGPEDIAEEGIICCTQSRLWRCGDGFGKMSYLDIVRDDFDDFAGKGELGVSPKSGDWQSITFGGNAGAQGEDEKGAAKAETPMGQAERLPVPRKGAGFVPVSTGAGREYLLLFMGQEGRGSNLGDVWSFQVRSEKRTPAMVKDAVRRAFGKDSGEDKWARAEVVESTKEAGPLDLPGALSRFGSASWNELGSGGTVIWGGEAQGGQTVGDGWIMVAE